MTWFDDGDAIEELPLFAMCVSVLVASFLVGAIVGAEAMAAGKPRFPPAYLPGFVWEGRATQAFVNVYSRTTGALWACAIATVGSAALVEARDRL